MKSKIHFYIGKGGVGKSTISSLYSVYLSDNHKVNLASLDSAHNLSDIFNISFSDRPKDISSNLKVTEVNIENKIKEYLGEIENDLAISNTNLAAFNLLDELNIIKQSPGLEEYGLLKSFSDIIENHAEADHLIFDMPPTALSMKFFSLPSRSLLWIEKLIDLRNRIKEKKEIVSTIKIGKSEIEQDKILKKLLELKKQFQTFNNLLKSEKVEINLVVNQDSLSINEGRKIINELEIIGFKVDKIIINKFDETQQTVSAFELFDQVKIPISKEKLIGYENLKTFAISIF